MRIEYCFMRTNGQRIIVQSTDSYEGWTVQVGSETFKATSVNRLRDGGTTTIVCPAGTLYVLSRMRGVKRTWNGEDLLDC